MATVASPVPLARGSVVSAVPLPPATFTVHQTRYG